MYNIVDYGAVADGVTVCTKSIQAAVDALPDDGGDVILPEDDQRHFTLPEVLRANPTQPLVYGGVTLIGTEADNPVFICIPGDSAETQNCARLAAELINMILHSEIGHAGREQMLRMILRGDVDCCEISGIAAEQGFADEQLHCHYRAETGDDFARFILWRTREDLHDLAQEAERLGIKALVGLWQEWKGSKKPNNLI